MFMYCCPNCRTFEKHEEKNNSYPCVKCNRALLSLSISEATWNAMPKEEKRDIVQMAMKVVNSGTSMYLPNEKQNKQELNNSMATQHPIPKTKETKNSEEKQSFFSDVDSDNSTKKQRFCSSCGARISMDAKFCPECGETLGISNMNQSANNPLDRPSQNQRYNSHGRGVGSPWKYVLIGSFVIAFLLVVVIAGVLLKKKNKDDDKENIKSGMDLLTNKEDFSDFVNDNSDMSYNENESTDYIENNEEMEILNGPYGMYWVDEPFAKERGGYYVIRDDKLYSVASLVPKSRIDEVGVGCTNHRSTSFPSFLYIDDKYELNDTTFTKHTDAIISAGDFPILSVKKSEKIVGYNITNLPLVKTDFIGYSIEAVSYGGDRIWPVLTQELPVEQFGIPDNSKHLSISDLNGKPINDFRNLEYNEECFFEWYEGTEYHGEKMFANCRCYRKTVGIAQPKEGETGYNIEGELTKLGYAAFDLSSLEPGFYICYYGAIYSVIEITED